MCESSMEHFLNKKLEIDTDVNRVGNKQLIENLFKNSYLTLNIVFLIKINICILILIY